MTPGLRSGLCAGVFLTAWTAGCFCSPVLAEEVRDGTWQVAQAQRPGDNEKEEEQRRKGRQPQGKDERRDEQRRSGPQPGRPAAAPQQRQQPPQHRQAQPQRPAPAQKEARPPVRPSIINEKAADRAKEIQQQRAKKVEELRARQKQSVERAKEVQQKRARQVEELRAKQKESVEQRMKAQKERLEHRKEVREERKDDRRDAREERLDDKRDAREERIDDRRDAREERRDDRRDAREERREDWQDRREERAERQFRRLDDLKQLRRQRVEDGGRRVIIEEPDRRVIVREQGRTIIRHDDSDRFRRRFRDARVERRPDGGTQTTYIRPDGVRIVSVVDSRGRLLHRYRRHRDGRIVVLIDNRRYHRPGFAEGLFLGAFLDLRPPVVRIPREKYIVDYEDASEEDIYEALSAPPVDELDRGYSLDEIRYNQYLRERMRRIDLDSINFEFGSWEVGPDQYHKLERMAKAINYLLEKNPEEIILIEGYTDAVGTDEDNLTLSDHRAEAVAMILSDEFGVPPENLVTQGYGEQFLKVETDGPERENRRVAVRRVTPLLSRSEG